MYRRLCAVALATFVAGGCTNFAADLTFLRLRCPKIMKTQEFPPGGEFLGRCKKHRRRNYVFVIKLKSISNRIKKFGFKSGIYNPCMYRHDDREIQNMSCGDASIWVGNHAEWVRKPLEATWSIKSNTIDVW